MHYVNSFLSASLPVLAATILLGAPPAYGQDSAPAEPPPALLIPGPALLIPEPAPAPLVVAPAEPPAPPAPDPKTTAPYGGVVVTGSRASVVIGGYAEVFYQWNFNQPINGITNYRGFDNHHNTVTIANTSLDVAGTAGPVAAHITLQIGHTAEDSYLAEPNVPGSSGAAPSNPQVWKFIQQAIISYQAPLGRGLLIEAGIYLSPIGIEGLQIKDQWNWSRSNLFFGLPYYHTGIRLTYPVTERLHITLHANNGWNTVVDNNAPWSLAGQAVYTIPGRLTLGFVYFTGIERPTGAPEGQPWRHLFDGYVLWQPLRWLSMGLQLDGGFEPNQFGTSWWSAGAGYLRFHPHRTLYLAGRADLFYENVPENADGRAASIFFPVSLANSQTVTAQLVPHDNVSFWLEYRHDQASEPMFFTGESQPDVTGRIVPDASRQDTLTVGMVAWF